ncbi:hypothetical protein SAMN05660841_00713 [Sphingobacterium nematocida]|uniref:LTXXQ motif family protein n=1 Tax=Sphingobacterium nematocida TaxID=1513896 RepID=A0A1T5BIE0_9SPHI|nr:hypothetical protein [Sphingobacterium nematocida]SKB47016.1 hypothetical protein SAMN05660841_00713 [Sphingobacterium nematocida]
MLRLKYILTTFLLVFTLHIVSFAQQNKFEAIESEKIAYITKELKITPSEAQKFFPIYNKYTDQLKDLKKAKRGGIPQQANSFNGGRRDVIAFDAKEVEMKKQYREDFAKVIGQARASQFFQVEEDFNDLLRNTLQERQKKGRQR